MSEAEKTKEQLMKQIEETVDRLIELGKVKPEERTITIQALWKANNVGIVNNESNEAESDETQQDDN